MAAILNFFGIGSPRSNEEERRPLRRTLSERIPALSEVVRANILNTLPAQSDLSKMDRNVEYSSLWLVGASRKVYACQGQMGIAHWINPIGMAVQHLNNVRKADLPERCYIIKIKLLKSDKPVTDGNYFIVTMDGTAIQAPFLDEMRKHLNETASKADELARKMDKPFDKTYLMWLQIFGNPRKFQL